MVEKELPHSLEAEEAVLGSLLIDNSSYFQVCYNLAPDDFYREKNMWIYQARQKLDMCDQVTMAHQLAKDGRLEAVGGAAYLSHLIANTATSVHIEYYADILHKLGDSRRLIRAGADISNLGFNQNDEGMTEALKLILALKGKSRDIVTPEDLSEYALGRLDKLANGDIIPTLFGIRGLDILGGMQPGELVVLGGETEMGKTTLMNQIARFQKGPVLFCTTEMTRAQWAQREAARLMHTKMENLGLPDYLQKNKDRWLLATNELKKSNVHVLVGSVTTKQIYSEAANLQGCSLIIVDYLQRLKGVRANYDSVSMASREIADIAKSLEIPVILSSQLSRDTNIDKNGKVISRPLLTRLKDSGNIENDADWVMFIKRDKGARPKTPEFLLATLMVEKHKQGGGHPEITLKFNVENQTYEEVI